MDKNNFGLQPLPKDDRDFQLGKFIKLPDLKKLPDSFQLEGYKVKHQGDSDMCTAFGTCGMSELQEEVELEPTFSFMASKIISGNPEGWGQNLRDAFKSHVKYGALESEESPYSLKNSDYRGEIRKQDVWPDDTFEEALNHKKQSYFFITGQYDPFDNIRAAIWLYREKKQAVGLGVKWVWPLDKATIPTSVSGSGFGHFIYCIGWKKIKGKDYLVIVNSYGEKSGDKGLFYFPREVINKWVGKYGAGMFVDVPPEEVKKVMKGTSMKPRSNLFELNFEDIGKGILTAAISAVVMYVYQLVSQGGVIDYRELLTVAATAGLGYLVKNLFEDSDGDNKITGAIGKVLRRK